MFIEQVDRVRRLLRDARLQVKFTHVPRGENVLADTVGRVAERLQQAVDLSDLRADLHAAASREPDAGGVFLVTTPIVSDEDLAHRPCVRCLCTCAPTSMLVCDACKEVTCLTCCGLATVPRGFWYCATCEHKIARGELRDITVDQPLMQYVFEGIPPPGDHMARVSAAARFL